MRCRHCKADIEETNTDGVYVHSIYQRRGKGTLRITWIYCAAQYRPDWDPDLTKAEP